MLIEDLNQLDLPSYEKLDQLWLVHYLHHKDLVDYLINKNIMSGVDILGEVIN